MRYLDWDVLLFPDNNIEPERNHIPLKEFRTACYALDTELAPTGVLQSETLQTRKLCTCKCVTCADRRPEPKATPLLNCYVPSLPRGSVFYLSIHCWSPASLQFPHVADTDPDVLKVWQVKVIIDGQCVT